MAERKSKSRNVRQREAYDAMLTPMKDFYDFSMDCYRELGRQKRREKVFRETLLKVYRRQEAEEGSRETVEDAVFWAAGRLSDLKSQKALMRWGLSEERNKSEETFLTREMWEQTLLLWCSEDSFPYLPEKAYSAERRDVVLYVIMVLGFTVEESTELLEEFSRRKDRDEYRRLYQLDLKEAVFLFFMEWNETHPEGQISYAEVCSRFEQYGRKLLRWLDREVRQVELEAKEPVWENRKPLEEFQSHYKRLWERLFSDGGKRTFLSPVSVECLEKIDVFNGETLEDMKRLLAVLSSAGRHMGYKSGEKREQGIQELRRRNELTRANRGTRAAADRINRLTLASAADLDAAFDSFCREIPDFCSEAHWRRYSVIMRLYAQAGKGGQNQGFLTERRRPSERTVNPRRYRSLCLTNGDMDPGKTDGRLSFSYGGEAVNRLIEAETSNSRLMTDLMLPVLKNGASVFGGKRQDSSVLFHLLKNNYQHWILGKKGPYQAYKRETILKVLLAAGIDTAEKLLEGMELSGSPGLDLFNRQEAMAYLIISYRQKIKRIYLDLWDLECSWEEGFSGEEYWEDCGELLLELPPELRPGFEDLDLDEAGIQTAGVRLSSDPSLLCAEILDSVEKFLHFPAAYDLKRFDLLCLSFESEGRKASELGRELFYGPYTGDFEGGTMTERREMWGCVWKAGFSASSAIGRTKEVFRLWQETMELGETFSVEFPEDGKKGEVAELHLKHLSRNLSERNKENREEQKVEMFQIFQNLSEILKKAKFLSQSPAALEAEAALEFLLCVLAACQEAGAFGREYEEAKYQVSRCVQSWILASGIRNMNLRAYRKVFGCEQYRPSAREVHRQEMEETGEIPGTVRDWEDADYSWGLSEKDFGRQNQKLMWERIHADRRLLEEALWWLEKNGELSSHMGRALQERLDRIYSQEFKGEEEKFLQRGKGFSGR